MEKKPIVHAAYRLIAEYADGERVYCDGTSPAAAEQRMEDLQSRHGDVVWYDTVTDMFYESGWHIGTRTPPPEITVIDLGNIDREGM